MSSDYENENGRTQQDIEISGSSLSSSSTERKSANIAARETSPLLGAADEAIAPAALQISIARRILLVTTISSAGMLNRFTVQAIVIMLPSISEAFLIPESRQQMIISTYSVASGSSMLLWGRVADVHGRWGVFLMGATLLAIFTFLVPFAPSEPFLYPFQALQGFSSAATVPSGIGILASTFPPGKERNCAFVALTASSSVGSILGNIAGGAIGGLLSWKWGFWIPAAFAAVVAVVAYGLFASQPIALSTQGHISSTENHNGDSHTNLNSQSVDYVGGILIATCLALLQIGLSQGNVEGWNNLHVPGLLCASIILGYLFVNLQLQMEHRSDKFPLVRLSMFRNSGFSAAFAVVAFFFGSFNSFLVYASMFFQNVLKLSMLETTLRFLPGGIIGGLACFVVAPALSALRGFHMLIFGITCSIISPLLFALPMGSSFSYWARGFPAMCLCLSAEVVWAVMGLYVARSVAEPDQSLAGALLQSANHIGRGLGLALAAAAQVIALSAGPESGHLLRGLQAAQWTNVGMSALSLSCTLVFFRDLGRV